MLSQFVFVLKMRSNKLKRPRGPCCRSSVFVLKVRSNKTEKTERAMLSQFCVRSENEKQKKLKRPRGPCCRSFVFVLKMRSNKL